MLGIFKDLLEVAAEKAAPYIAGEGWEKVPEEARGEIVAGIFAGETEFTTLVKTSETSVDDALVTSFIEKARAWHTSVCPPEYGTSFPAQFEAHLDKLVNGKLK